TPLVRRRVAGADADRRLVREREPGAVGRVLDARQWGAEVLLDVDGQGAERRDVEDAGALQRRRRRFGGEPVDREEERGERLPRTRRSQDQRVVAAGDRHPAVALGRGGLVERGVEPRADRGGEDVERHRHTVPAPTDNGGAPARMRPCCPGPAVGEPSSWRSRSPSRRRSEVLPRSLRRRPSRRPPLCPPAPPPAAPATRWSLLDGWWSLAGSRWERWSSSPAGSWSRGSSAATWSWSRDRSPSRV